MIGGVIQVRFMVSDIGRSTVLHMWCAALGVKAGLQMAGVKKMLDRIAQS